MQTAATIGLDIAKNVFQVHGIASDGRVVFRQQVKRNRVLKFFEKLEPCVVGIEACATSHHWAREIGALGHTVKLMPPKYVKAYVKRQKNDAADAEAICEAVQRPSMRFVPIKSPDDQAGLVLHRTRHLFVRQLTAVVNALRAHMAEFGIVAAKGREGVAELVAIIKDLKNNRLPEPARACLYALAIQLDALSQQIAILDKRLNGWCRTNETCRRLDVMPGVGPALATALVASIPDPLAFRCGRDFAAWIGLVPKQNSSGGKERLGSITKEGDRYLRSLFCAGALAVIRYAQKHGTSHRPWLTSLLARRPAKVAAIALANKLARMAWAIMAKGEDYREPVALAR
jgi:transposase